MVEFLEKSKFANLFARKSLFFAREHRLVSCWWYLMWFECLYCGLEHKGSKTHSKSSRFDYVLALPKNDRTSAGFWKFPDSGGMFIRFWSSSLLISVWSKNFEGPKLKPVSGNIIPFENKSKKNPILISKINLVNCF